MSCVPCKYVVIIIQQELLRVEKAVDRATPQPAMFAAAAAAAVFLPLVVGHAAMVQPPPRNAVDRGNRMPTAAVMGTPPAPNVVRPSTTLPSSRLTTLHACVCFCRQTSPRGTAHCRRTTVSRSARAVRVCGRVGIARPCPLPLALLVQRAPRDSVYTASLATVTLARRGWLNADANAACRPPGRPALRAPTRLHPHTAGCSRPPRRRIRKLPSALAPRDQHCWSRSPTPRTARGTWGSQSRRYWESSRLPAYCEPRIVAGRGLQKLGAEAPTFSQGGTTPT